MFYWAREKKLDTLTIPTKQITITDIATISEDTISTEHLAETALRRTTLVRGKFRQEEIRENWRQFAKDYGSFTWSLVTLRVSCSSGTYMRQLALDIGKQTNTPAMAFRIIREQIGEYSRTEALTLT